MDQIDNTCVTDSLAFKNNTRRKKYAKDKMYGLGYFGSHIVDC